MKGNKILYAGIAILILGIGFAVGTYAYYQTTITGNVGGTVLAWQCTANNQSATFDITLGSLYPGSSGDKTITIRSTIDANYTITFDNFANIGSGSTHENLNLYSDASHNSIINEGNSITGSVTAGTTGTAVKFYYYWPYGQAAETYDASAPSVTATITCTQR